MECSVVDSLFPNAKNDTTMMSKYLDYAENDKELTNKLVGGGYYQCFCKKFSTTDVFAQKASEMTNKYLKKNSTSKSLDEKAKLKNKMNNLCYDFQMDKYQGYALTGAVSTFVSVFNIAIRYVVMALIDLVKLETRSQVTSSVMIFVFFASFIGTGILGLLANSDLYYTAVLGKMLPFLQGQYSDLNRDWYITIGPQMI